MLTYLSFLDQTQSIRALYTFVALLGSVCFIIPVLLIYIYISNIQTKTTSLIKEECGHSAAYSDCARHIGCSYWSQLSFVELSLSPILSQIQYLNTLFSKPVWRRWLRRVVGLWNGTTEHFGL